MMETKTASPQIDDVDALPDDTRAALRELLLTLADNKRILGLRYADWMLGAPTLETGIAASSMAQDEWGHGRLTYALLGDFGDDPRKIEHERDADRYHSSEILDRRFGSWQEMIAVALLFDSAVAQQYAGLVDSRYAAARTRVQKMLDEEAYHFQYAAGWIERLAASAEARTDLEAAVGRVFAASRRWLMAGPEGGRAAALARDGVLRTEPEAAVAGWVARVAPVLERAGLLDAAGVTAQGDRWSCRDEPDWSGWDDGRRRVQGSPDEDTVARARGDRNRAMRLD